MRELLLACRERFGPAPRSLSAAQAEQFRLRLYPVFENVLRELSDPILRNFTDQDLLRDRGEVVWGYVVQANDSAYNPRSIHTVPAHLVFSPDPWFESRPQELGRVARQLASLKGTVPDDPQLRPVMHVLTDEKARLLCAELPRGFCPGRSVYYTT